MIDYEKFKQELVASVKEAEELNGGGPDVHSKILEIILQDIKNNWSHPDDALGEIDYVVKKVFRK